MPTIEYDVYIEIKLKITHRGQFNIKKQLLKSVI